MHLYRTFKLRIFYTVVHKKKKKKNTSCIKLLYRFIDFEYLYIPKHNII